MSRSMPDTACLIDAASCSGSSDVRANKRAAASASCGGETVLVVSDAAAIRNVVAPMVGLGEETATSLPLADCAPVEVTVDADGWVLRGWSGAASLGTGPYTGTEMRDSGPK